MSIITNKKHLPLPVVLALKKMRDSYDKGESDYSATGLLKPARIVMLERKHEGELEEDAFNLIQSAHGTALHAMFEAAGKEIEGQGYIVEKRFYITVDGKKIGAKIDLFDTNTGILYDYKTSSVASIKHGLKEEHVQQLNIGAECLRQNGIEVKGLRVALFPVDWRAWEGTKEGYPERYSEREVPIIPSEEVLAFISDRLKVFKKAEKKLPLCSREETWQGRRCESYCPVAKHCKQFQEAKRAGVKLMPAKSKESK